MLKGVTERPEVSLVRLREIKCKIDKKNSVQDRHKNTICVKDVVRIVDGPCKVRTLDLIHITTMSSKLCYIITVSFILGKARSCGTHIQGSIIYL